MGKSTATHACILAPDEVTIYSYPVSLCSFEYLFCRFIHSIIISRFTKVKQYREEYQFILILSFPLLFLSKEVPKLQEKEKVLATSLYGKSNRKIASKFVVHFHRCM